MMFTRSIDDYPEGIILPIDKPYRWTSADVIRKIKFAAVKHFGKKNLKVGHAGTLDPLATGLLIVCIGKATKKAEEIQRSDKEYIAGITFGATTPSYDLEKPIDEFYPTDKISEDSVKEALESFIGEQEQIAPLFSAKLSGGVRAYELARRLYRSGGKLDEEAQALLTKQKIRITGAELLKFEETGDAEHQAVAEENSPSGRIKVSSNHGLGLPRAVVRIACSKGTYIRALARDLGEALQSGAHLDSLQRTKCGNFDIEQALSLEQALALLSKEPQTNGEQII